MADAQARIRITAQDDSAAAFKKASANLEALQASAASLAGSLGGALAVGGLTALITGAIDAADNLRDLSQATGITVESLGGLGFAAGQNGGSLEGVASAAGKLNKALAEAAAGSKDALEPFNKLGISVKDAAGQTKAADVVFAEIADRFKTFNDGPEKAALALKLFGKAGSEQIALLNEGGEALRANIEYYKRFSGVTTEIAAASDQFNDTLGKVKLLSQSLGTSIAAALLPGLQAVADELLALKENGGGFAVVGSAIKIVFEAISITVANVSFVLKAMGREIGAIAAQAVALSRLDLQGFRAISDAVKADGVRARAELDALERRILGIGTINANDESAAEKRRLGLSTTAVTKTNAPRLSGASGGGDKARKDIDLTNKALASYLEQLDRQLQKNQDLSATEEALAFLRTKGAGATLDQVAAVLSRARALDQEAEQLDRIRLKQQLSIEAGNEVDRANGARAQQLQSLLSGTTEDRSTKVQQGIALLKEELDKFTSSAGTAGISLETYREAVQNLAGISTEVDKAKGLAEELGLSFNSAFEDAIVGGKSFSEVLKGLEQDILRIITRQFVTKPIADGIGEAIGGGGGIGGIFGNLFKGLFGARAGGGPVQAGGSYLVGERGPEIFKAPSSGTIVPTSQLAGAGGRSMVIHINPPAGMSRQSSTQFAADVARQLNLASTRNN